MAKVHIAEEALQPSIFVTMDGTTGDYKLLAAETGDFPYGITADYSEVAPIPNVTTTNHASEGGVVAVITEHGDKENSTQMLRISAAVVRGDRLMPDGTGNGTAIKATPGNWYGAVAEESGAAGEAIRVMPRYGYEEGNVATVTATTGGATTGLIPADAKIVTVTSDSANKQISLPAGEIGKELTIVVGTTACELISSVAADKVNEVVVGATNELALTAEGIYWCRYTKAGCWVVTGTTKLGAAIATLVPDAL